MAAKKAVAVKKTAQDSKTKVEKFFRIVEHPLKPGEVFRGYQGEEISIDGDRVIGRKLIDKSNLFEYAQTHIVDLMDPRNNVKPEIF